MAKLRKMLGSIEDPHTISLMRLIETQSKVTLATWAIDYAENNFLKIYEQSYPDDHRLYNVIGASKEFINGTRKLSEVKLLLKEAKQIAKEVEENPVLQTPTNALGFTFYGAAAIVYHLVGLSEDVKTYDELASIELEKMLKSLQRVAVENEEHPVKINWNC